MDDFLEVLRWSDDFGTDTTDGREIMQGVVGVFAAGAFDRRDHVEMRSEKLKLSQYAARRNLQIITSSDFNGKLKERGCPKSVTVHKICKAARDESEVRDALDLTWKKPEDADAVLSELHRKNEDLYKFEEILSGGEKTRQPFQDE